MQCKATSYKTKIFIAKFGVQLHHNYIVATCLRIEISINYNENICDIIIEYGSV